MANKHKIVEKFAQPIAEILYLRGYRKIDSLIDIVSNVIVELAILSDEERKEFIARIEKELKEYHYD